MNRFLILALPRSRTAWLSNFLNFGDIRCAHELLFDVGGHPDRMQHAMDMLGGRFNGICDTAAAFWYEQLVEMLGNPPTVVIRRDMNEVGESMLRNGIENSERVLEHLLPGLDLAQSHGALTVQYDHLDSEMCCRAIQEHIAPGTYFDARRWRMLEGMNVQVTPHRFNMLTNPENYLAKEEAHA